MYHYIVDDNGASWEKFSESISRFSHLIISGLIKDKFKLGYF